MKVLVTGGAGFIGSHVVDLLIKEGNNVFIIDNLSSGKIENINPRAIFYQESLKDYQKIKEIFEKEKPDIVYHLAAQIDIRKSVDDPIEDAQINIMASLNLLELSKEYKVKHFIFSSTGGAIYGDMPAKELPTLEDHKENPLSPYGCAKLSVEKYLKFYNKVHKLKYTILRYSNVYGPRQNAKGEAGVVSIFFDKMFAGQKPTIFGGVQTRDFVYVGDVAIANLMVLGDQESRKFNISTAKETDIIEIFSKINKYFQNKYEPEFQEMKKGEQKKSCISYQKIKNILGWKPLTDLNEGLDKTYAWYVKNRK